MSNDEQQIGRRCRACCDACQSGQLSQLPNFWDLPAMFTVSTGGTTTHTIMQTAEELVNLYSGEFGSESGVDRTVIDTQEIEMYGDGAATVKTSLNHLASGTLHDRQFATYGCRKVDGVWMFCSHMSRDELVDAVREEYGSPFKDVYL